MNLQNIAYVHMFSVFSVLLLLFALPSAMCLHTTDKGTDALGRNIQSIDCSLDEFDQCDYVDSDYTCNVDDLCVIQLNIRGLCSKQSQLKQMIDNCMSERIPDMVILCETWLTLFSPSVTIPGYDLCHKDRQSKRGGGVALLISNKVRYKMLNIKSSCNTTFESICAELELKNKQKLIISSLYRPPNTSEKEFIDQYCKFVCELEKRDNNGIIVGSDHNMDLLKSSNHAPTENFLNANLSLNLVPTITHPTCITKSTATLIDNIFISQSWLEKYNSGILVNDMSDHLPSIVSIKNLKLSKRVPVQITSRDTRTKNINALKNSLKKINWCEIIEPSSPSKSMSNLHERLRHDIDHFTPLKTYCINSKKARREPWVSAGIQISIRKSKKLYRTILHKDATDANRAKYKAYATLLQHLKRQSKCMYYGEKCMSFRHNTKKLWSVINDISAKQNDKSSLIDCLRISNVLEYDANKIANKFGEYFASVGKSYSDKVANPVHDWKYYCDKIERNTRTLYMKPCTEFELQKLIRNLPSKTSSGHDNISNVLLKSIGDYLVTPLTRIFNDSIQLGIFPEIMKLADIVPLYKSKEKYLETNYRPISLLTTMSKLLEKIVYVRVYEFLNSSGQFYESQYRFQSSHSCDNAVGEVVSRIVKNLEAGKINIAIFLDLSKAFDTLNHNLLLHKMERYGIRGITLEWFRSYLYARKLCVKCKPTSTGQLTTSEEYTVEYGAPQGSCLGPLLFLIFCNDLNLNLEYLHVVQFADDTTLTMGHRNHNYLKYCIETDLTSVQDWFNANTLTLNLSKSNYMTFFPHSKKEKITLNLSLNGVTLPKTTSTKFLGTWIDDKLIWKEHLIRLTTKLTSRLGMLKHCKCFLTVHAMKTLYYA